MDTEQQVLLNDGFEDEVRRLTDVEGSAFASFSRMYMSIYPPPLRIELKQDWEFWTALTTSVSAVLLASFRTGQAFFLAATTHGNPLFSVLEAVVAVASIEGSLVLFALQDARAKRISMDANTRMMGLAVTLIISSLAGLYQSTGILAAGNTQNAFVSFLNWALVISMGLGATAIAFLGGNILGVQIVRYENAISENDTAYEESHRMYMEKLYQAWADSKENSAIQSRKRTNYRNERLDNERTPRVRSLQRTNERTPRGGTNESRDEIFALMDKYFVETGGSAPGQAQVCRMLAFQRDGSEEGFERFKGYVNKVYHLWTPPQQFELPIQEGA